MALDPKNRKWLLYGGGGVVAVFLVAVYRSRQSQKAAAAAGAAQVQTYPVGVYPPNNAEPSAIAALLANLGGGLGAPGSLKASISNRPVSFYPVDQHLAQRLLDQGGGVYYQPSAGIFVPTGSKLSVLPAGTQLYGSSLLEPSIKGQVLGTPASQQGTP